MMDCAIMNENNGARNFWMAMAVSTGWIIVLLPTLFLAVFVFGFVCEITGRWASSGGSPIGYFFWSMTSIVLSADTSPVILSVLFAVVGTLSVGIQILLLLAIGFWVKVSRNERLAVLSEYARKWNLIALVVRLTVWFIKLFPNA